MADAERYLVTCHKLPYEERDVAHASPFMDTYEEVHPGQVGMQVTYSVDLDEEWVESFRQASNLVDLLKVSDYPLGFVSDREEGSDNPIEQHPLATHVEGLNLPDFGGTIELAGNDPQLRAPVERYWRTGSPLDQGQEGACTGFSATNFLNAEPIMGRLGNDYAFEVYKRAQQLDEWPGEDYDGSSVNAACKVLRERGFIKEYAWARTFDEIHKWLLYKGGIMLGMDWYEGMYRPDVQGFIRPTGRQTGGHAIFCRGVSKWGSLRLFNSWGDGWGNHGRCWLSKADCLWLMRSPSFRAAAAVQIV